MRMAICLRPANIPDRDSYYGLEATMQRKPNRHFALALLMAVFAIYPSRLNPEGLTTVDIAVIVIFAIAALAFLVVGISGVRRQGQ